MKFRKISIGKDNFLNEDSVIADCDKIAVSDGAGGGGMFANLWSTYLLQQLPNKPIVGFKALDKWIESIWETFYNQVETIAKNLGAIELNKFYDEGSLATLEALWVQESNIEWISYGDSAVFCYDFESKKLISNIVNPIIFNDAPYLININAPLIENGFKQGSFPIRGDKIFFCATDALAHYIIVSYIAANRYDNTALIKSLIEAKTKNSNFINTILIESNIDFEHNILMKLFNCAKNKSNFAKHIKKLQKSGKLAIDDNSIAFLY